MLVANTVSGVGLFSESAHAVQSVFEAVEAYLRGWRNHQLLRNCAAPDAVTCSSTSNQGGVTKSDNRWSAFTGCV